MTEPLGASPVGVGGPGSIPAASEIPSVPGPTVQDDLDALAYIETAAQLEARFPASGGVHTVDQGSEWRLPKGATEIDIGSNTIVGVWPGGITFVGGQGTIKTDADATLASGELACKNVVFKNVNSGVSGRGIDFESLFARTLVLTDVGIMAHKIGRLANVAGSGTYENISIIPLSPGATGLEIDGTNGIAIFRAGFVATPGTLPFTGIRVLGSAFVGGSRLDSVALQDSVAGDALIYVDAAVSMPPTSTISVGQCAKFGPGEVFDSAGLGTDDPRILSLNNVNAPSSKWLGDVVYDSAGGAPIDLTHTGGVEVMPNQNVGPTAIAVLTAGSERFEYAPTALQDWEMVGAGRTDDIQGEVSWKATVKRNGGTIREFFGWVQYRTGPDPAPWVTIGESVGERSLNTTYDTVSGSAPFQWNRLYEFRLAVQGIVATSTHIKNWRVQPGPGRP